MFSIYGRGGLDEIRRTRDNSLTNKVFVDDYVKHISMLSMPQMQRPLLQLGLSNMYLKQKLVQSVYHQISSPQQATDLLHGLNYDYLCFSANLVLKQQKVDNY